MENKKSFFRVLFTLVIFLLITGQQALAESSWTVENSNGNSNTFTIKRSEKGYSQKVLYRTISLSAYAGQHYTAKYGELEFLENEDTKTVTVNELTPSDAFLNYTDGTTVKYGFEVTDRAGFRLGYAERKKTWGSIVNSSNAFSEQELVISSDAITVTDGGYDQAYRTVSVNNYFTATAPKTYLSSAGAQLRMTVTFDAREKDDGYQYVAIYANTATSNVDTGAKDGDPGTINYSKYMAGFTIDGNGAGTYYSYTFPLTSKGNNCGSVAHPWSGNANGNLVQQYFNTDCRASDGRLIIPTELSSLYIRFNASGNNSDSWYAQNVKVHIQAVDITNPTKSEISVNPGRHAKGNIVYVSVAFSEIVNYTGTRKLNTSWGELSYVTGSGTNVLTFSGIIPQDATESLSVSGISGNILDLAGKNLSGSVTAYNLCSLDGDLAYTISDFVTDRSGNYLITCLDDLRGLAGYVNGGGSTQSKTFLQVTDLSFPHNDNWNNANSTENNFTAIGTTSSNKPFRGTFDGQGHTISGIRIYKGDTSNQGLFGYVGGGGIVKHINLADARITGLSGTGGIVGTNNNATIEECTVATTVCIHTVQNSYHHGGIVGKNENGSVCRCISRATLTVKNGLTDCLRYGGIVGSITGYNSLITDCIADGVVIPDVNGRDAIVGDNNNGTLTRNYYLNCTVAGATESDIYTITLGTNISINHSPEATLPGTNNATYDNGADINGVPYAKASSVVNLSYNPAAITEGYDVLLAVKKNSSSATVVFTDNGDYTYTIASMPAADITISATEIPIISYIDADGNPQSHACTPIVSGTNSYQTFGRTEGWYVVNSDVTISGTKGIKFLDQKVNIILCDGATLTSNANGNDFIGLNAQNGSIVIYGQSLGSGTLSARTNANAIKAKSNIDLNGGNVDVASSANAGIIADGIITIRRGNIMAQGRSTGISSIYNNVIILGGNVSAVGDYFGISANNITLGYASVTDRITANIYTCNTLTIADGQTLTDGEGSIISGTYTDDDLLDARSALDGKTLQPAYSITLPDDFTLTGTTAHQGYAPAGEEVTLHTDAGYTINSASYTPVGGSATTITPVEGVWSFTLPAANTTVSAERSANTYTVHFDANYDNNGIVISGTMDDMAFTYDQAQAITSNTYERTGYTFTGWNTQPDGNGDSYTDGQSVDNLTTELNGVVTLYAQWSIIDWTGTGTSENNPYLISFASQLVKLSNDVNGGNKYTGLFIKLGNDIDMNGVVFEGIGSRLNYFEGTFDGDGYTISNVTIDRSNGSDVVGFFGHISEGTVKNLIIDGASITGKNYVGGIIGYSYKTTISNCLVLNTSITVTTGDKCGVYGHSGGSLTLTNNHYNNCTVTIGKTTYTTNIGVSSNDLDGVGSIHTITLPEHITAVSAETVTIGTTTYYASNVTVTLTTDQGFSLSDVTVNGTPATHNQDGTWSFTMPAANATVSAERNANTYTVHFDANATNGINTNGTMDDMTFTYDQAQAIISNTYERTGYTFTGWNTEADGTGTAYTNGQSVNNLTTELNGVVTLYAQWSIIDWTGTGTSENDPYLITFASQLVKLSNDVNGGNKYIGRFFKLGNDIDMNGVAFDGIGIVQNIFSGTFDGDGKTISNITINKSNSFVDVGFFGYIFNGTVKNLIIDGASITGKNYVGGIIGYSYETTVSNCLVLNTSITVTNGNNCGVYGYNGGSLTTTNNHYNNCTVTIGETTYTTNIGVSRKDLDGVRSVYTLSLPEHVTAASAETVTIGTTTYYASKVQVTLTPDQGFSLSDVTVNGTPATHKQDGTWSFSMPAADAVVSATICVPYIDADGQEQQCTNYTLLSSGGQLDDGWYVVRGDITIDEGLNFEQSDIHLILCDGATLYLTSHLGDVIYGRNLSIYGQRLGSGSINVTCGGYHSCFSLSSEFTINGGNINVAFDNSGNLSGAHPTWCIVVGFSFTINGGIVNVNGDEGISSRNITLGWRNTSDRITASSYKALGGTISVKSGQAFTDGTAVYTGTLTDSERNAIAGKTLQPCFRIFLPEHVVATGVISQNGTIAYALPGAEVSVASDFGFEISPVTYNGSNATANGDGTYTFTMPARFTTVSATVTDLWGIGAGKDGSTADNAYIITTTAGLNLLATQVNGGNDYYGTYFKLGGDIEYDSSVDNNYTAIGTYSNPFGGIFDGNGYTVSGINIQSNESYQGLIGMVSSDGEVRNVIVKDADIRGDYQIGAIAGGSEGTLENCMVVGTTVSGNYSVDMICSDCSYWTLIVNNCYYINCRNSNWSSGIYSSNLYTINAGDDVLWSINSYDKGIEYNGVLYFPLRANVSLDLSYTGQVPDGDVPVFLTTEGKLSRTANSYSLVIYGNATINAFIGKSNINYLDSIGTVRVCPAAVSITEHEGDLVYESGGWFVVNGQVTVNGMISFEKEAHIILCDGAILTADAIVSEYDDISIYAQSSGDDMGCINSGIYVGETLMINGGKITTNNKYLDDLDGIGLFADDMEIYSGIINTMGDSIVCDYMALLGWRNTTDCITAGGYRSQNFEIYPGQVLTDGNYLYYGLMNLTQIDEMSGKTLMPYQTYAVTESDGITDAIAADIAGEMVSFGRNYIENIATTICLPFSISDVLVGEIYKFVDVSYSNRDGWVATMEELETDYDGFLVTPTEAGKPYLFIPYLTGTWSFVGRVPDDVSSVAGATASGDWTFHGTYSRMNYGDEGFSGTVFGFAATDGKAADGVTDVEAGQFVKAASGAYILPFRAYLTYSGSNNALRAPGRDGTETPAIPSRIKVRLVRSNGITTAIGTMDRETGEVTIDQWFYLNGQPVEGAPTAPGLYLNSEGKKVMITE